MGSSLALPAAARASPQRALVWVVLCVLGARRVAGLQNRWERALFLGARVAQSIVVGCALALARRMARGRAAHPAWSVAREVAFGGAKRAIETGAELLGADERNFSAVTDLGELCCAAVPRWYAPALGCESIAFECGGVRCAVVCLQANAGAVRARLGLGASGADELAREQDLVYVLHAHGGGYCAMGLNAAHQASLELFKYSHVHPRAAQRLVYVHVDYTLGVERKWPAAIVDKVRVFDWLVGQGVPGRRIFLAGESGGAGLAACTALALRDSPAFLGTRGEAARAEQPAGAVLLSPMIDLTHDYPYETETLDFLTPELARICSRTYVPAEHQRSPYATPAEAESLAGLPPLLVQTGAEEIFNKPSAVFAAKAARDGTKVVFSSYEGMTHCFQHVVVPQCPITMRAIAEIFAFLHDHSPPPQQSPRHALTAA
jgi:acetyl esterase/lipase